MVEYFGDGGVFWRGGDFHGGESGFLVVRSVDFIGGRGGVRDFWRSCLYGNCVS